MECCRSGGLTCPAPLVLHRVPFQTSKSKIHLGFLGFALCGSTEELCCMLREGSLQRTVCKSSIFGVLLVE